MINSTITKVISLTLIFSIIGCEANGVIQSVKSNPEVEKNITSLAEIINSSNVNILEQLNDPVLMKMLAEDPDSEFSKEKQIFTPEEEAALKELYADPQKVFREIAKEEDGEEFISLMTAIVEQKDPEEIRSKLAYLLTVEELAEFDEQINKIEGELQSIAKTMGNEDKWLHAYAGASAAFLAASFAYKKLKWYWSPFKKAGALALVGLMAAVSAGALMEAVDALGFGTVDIKDFWVTVAGGAAASSVIFGVSCCVYSFGVGGTAVIVAARVMSAILAVPVGIGMFKKYKIWLQNR